MTTYLYVVLRMPYESYNEIDSVVYLSYVWKWESFQLFHVWSYQCHFMLVISYLNFCMHQTRAQFLKAYI